MKVHKLSKYWAKYNIQTLLNVQVSAQKDAIWQVRMSPMPFNLNIKGFLEVAQPAGGELTGNRVLLPGSFDPLHRGHTQMADYAANRVGAPVWFELSITNVDKQKLVEKELARRCDQPFKPHGLVLTEAATFADKAEIFPGTTFAVGADTITRIDDLRYYQDEDSRRTQVFLRLAELGVRFLVFPRLMDKKVVEGPNSGQTKELIDICDFISSGEFLIDESSTALRGRENSRRSRKKSTDASRVRDKGES